MFLEFYGLKQQPFGVTPDPRFLYLSAAHREAKASLYYGIEAGRGFLALIAKPGMGKTTLLFDLLEKFRTSARTAFLFQTQCSSREFMRFLLREVGSERNVGEDFVNVHEEFNRCLLEEARAGRRFIVVIDEAQNLDPSVLETVRLLSDFETPRAKLLQIVLAGQPELADKLARPDLKQLRQRISLFCSLAPLPFEEVEKYIQHRLRMAGFSGVTLFTNEALRVITDLSQGTPRAINNICFNALSLGFALQQKTIDVGIVREVATDLDLSRMVSESDASAEATASATFRPATELVASVSTVHSPDPKSPELLSPIEARAFMRKFVQLLNNPQGPVN